MKHETLARFNQVAAQFNASIATDYKSRHLVLIVTSNNGDSFFYPVPSSIDRSENRTLQNSLAGLKRQLRTRERYTSKKRLHIRTK